MRKPTLSILFLVVFVDLIGFGLILPVIPYLSQKFHASALELGLLLASYSCMQFLFAPLWGALSDRFGRRPIILLSLLGSTLSYLIFAFSANLLWILASRIFAGFFGANISVANAYAADITSGKDRAKGMGVIGAAFGIGFICGPLIGVAFSHYPAEYLGFVGSSICFLNLICAYRLLPESLSPEKRSSKVELHYEALTTGWKQSFSSPRLSLLMGITFLSNLALTMWETTFAYFLLKSPHFGYPMRTYFLLLTFVGIVMATIQGGTIGRLTKKFSEASLLKWGILLFTFSLLFIPMSQSLWVLLVALFFMSIGSAVVRPMTYSLVSKCAHEKAQGSTLGVAQSVSSLTRIIGPIVGGLLFDWGMGLPFWIGSLSLVLAFALATVFKQSESPEGTVPSRL